RSGVEGRDILSAFPDRRCALYAGTSMAAPHVSGALAALRAAGLGPKQAIDRLLATARPVGSAATYGHGIVDLRAALDPPGSAPATTTTRPAPTSAPPASAAPAPSEVVTRDEADPSTTTTAPSDGGSAAPVVVRDVEGDEARIPTALVVAAVAAATGTGVATGV